MHMDNEEKLRTENERLRDQIPTPTRRSLLRGAAAAGVGAVSLAAVANTAAANPNGTFPVITDDPLLKIRADRVRYIGRTSDPSDGGGTTWYRSDV